MSVTELGRPAYNRNAHGLPMKAMLFQSKVMIDMPSVEENYSGI
jgi:hypothetical protein